MRLGKTKHIPNPVIIFLAVTCAFLGSTLPAKAAPSFQSEILGGGTTSLTEHLRNDRLLFLSFWASWCTPCIEELKQMTNYLSKHPEFPVDVLTINVDTSETSTDVVPTLRLYKLSFPVILDPRHSIFEKYQTAKELPISFLISSSRKIERKFQGFHDNLFDEIRSVLNALNIRAEISP